MAPLSKKMTRDEKKAAKSAKHHTIRKAPAFTTTPSNNKLGSASKKASNKAKKTVRAIAIPKSPSALAAARRDNKCPPKTPQVVQALKDMTDSINAGKEATTRACESMVDSVRQMTAELRRNTNTARRYLKAAKKILKRSSLGKRKERSEEDGESGTAHQAGSPPRRVCLGFEHSGLSEDELEQEAVVEEPELGDSALDEHESETHESEVPEPEVPEPEVPELDEQELEEPEVSEYEPDDGEYENETKAEETSEPGLEEEVEESEINEPPSSTPGDLQYLCGHWVHPAHAEEAIDKQCPECRMRTCLKDVVCAQRWLMTKGDPRELSADEEREYQEKMSDGDSSIPGRNLSLRHSKVRQANLIAELEELCEVENAWTASRGDKEDAEWLSEHEVERRQYSAHGAMRLQKEVQDGYTVMVDRHFANLGTKRARETLDEVAQPSGRRSSKRQRVSFDDLVYVCAESDIDVLRKDHCDNATVDQQGPPVTSNTFSRSSGPIKMIKQRINGIPDTKVDSWSDERAPGVELINTSGCKMSPEQWERHVLDLQIEADALETAEEWEGSTVADTSSEDEAEQLPRSYEEDLVDPATVYAELEDALRLKADAERLRERTVEPPKPQGEYDPDEITPDSPVGDGEKQVNLEADFTTVEWNSTEAQNMVRPWSYEDIPSAVVHWGDDDAPTVRRFSV